MKPKEKAKEMMHYYLKELLSAKYSINGFVINDLAKQCALIAVDEILTEMSDYFDKYDCTDTLSKIEYWTEVGQEIKTL